MKKRELKKKIKELEKSLSIFQDQRAMLLENKPEDQYEISQMRACYLMQKQIDEALLFGSGVILS
jgi:hypothetical protein